jgi:signal transduction histidine kinase
MTIAGLIKLFTCLESLLLGVWTVKRDPNSRRSILFAAYMFVIATQAFIEFQLCQAQTAERFLFWKHFDIFVFAAIALLFHFALEYCGSKKIRSSLFLLLIYSVLGVVSLAQATAASPPSAVLTPWGYAPHHTTFSWSIYMVNVFIGVTFSLGIIVLFVKRLIHSDERRTSVQSAVMLSCMAVLISTGATLEVLVALGVRVPLSFSAVTAFIVINPIFAAAMFRYDILDISPRAASADILNTMKDGLILTDTRGIVRYANPALLCMFNSPSPLMIGKKLQDLPLRGGGDWNRPGSHFKAVPFDTTLSDWEGVVDLGEENEVPVSLSSTPFVSNGNMAGFIVTVRDISNRRQVEEIKQSVEKMMRHDLKNALTGILGFSELIGGAENLTDFQRRTVSIINKSGQLMLRQIEGYLALQRMESGTFVMDGRTTDVLDIADDVVRNLKGLEEALNVEIEIRVNGGEIGQGAVLNFLTQPALFFSILMNLTKNAVEASPPNHTVLVDLSLNHGLTVTIHNTGAVPEQIRDRFFTKFVTANKRNGTGLGAYSAKLITESLGGKIDFVSDETHGTTVTIFLPTQG